MKNKIDIEIINEDKKQLMKAQQGELDAVIIYHKLAEVINNTDNKKVFLKIAADEGKHASILKKYTGEKLRPKKFKSLIIFSIYKIFGVKVTLNILIKGELKAAREYERFTLKFPKIQQILKDEELHGELMKNML